MQLPKRNIANDEIWASLVAQAKVRTRLGIPICLLMLVSIWYFGSPYRVNGTAYTAAMTALYFSYNIISFIVANKRLAKPNRLLIATAVLDALMLSAWLVLTGDAAPLFIGFYLFSLLGFGFRLGTRAMWINQIAALIGFIIVMTVSPFWQSNLLTSASVLVLLVAVPMYATILIKKLLDARALAEFQSQAKSQLLANVSHELRTPLNGIVATAQIMKSESSSQKMTEQSETILELSQDLLREINELLDSAKYRAHGIRLDKAPFDLRRIAERLRMTLAQNAAAKGIRLSVIVDPRIEDDIYSDQHHLLRVLMNIASNAVKFTEHGKVSINFSLLDKTPCQYKIRFAVQDTGVGIPLDEQKKVFEPFYQIFDGSAKKQAGTGLGMSIAYDIVKMLGGTLEIESQLGRGSIFYFDILLDRMPKTETCAVAIETQSIVSGKKILVVEDHPLNLMLTRKILEIDRHIVSTAASGTEALKLVEAMEFDLIFLDYNLEGMSGIDIMQAYCHFASHPAPVYFVTADATDDTRHLLMEKGATGVMHKPLTLEALRRAISSHFAACNVSNGKRPESIMVAKSGFS